MNISINALVLSMFAVHRDIKHHEGLNNDQSLDQSTRESHGEYVLELTQVFGELGMAYEEAQEAHPDYPSIDVLLKKMELQ